jgi:hypothetical protein
MAKTTKTKEQLQAALNRTERTLEAFRAWHRLDGSKLPEHVYTSAWDADGAPGVPHVSVTVRGVSKAHGGVAWLTHSGIRVSEPILLDDLVNLWLALSEEHPLHAAGRALSHLAGRWCDAELAA